MDNNTAKETVECYFTVTKYSWERAAVPATMT